jgi:drug/metabolite transporter (DMT)-like permease
LSAAEGDGGPPAPVLAAFGAIYLVWGSTFLAIRWAVETIPPLSMMTARCLLGGSILFLLSRLREGATRPTAAELGGSLVVGALLFVGCHGLLAHLEQVVPSGVAALCLATIPLFVPLLAWLLAGAGPPAPRLGVALGAGFCGVALLVAAQGSGGALDAQDAALLLVSSFCWALGTIASRRLPMPQTPLAAAALPLLGGAAVLAVLAVATGDAGRLDTDAMTARSVGGLLYLVLLGTVVTFAAYMWLLGHVPASRVATYAFVNPVVAVLLGWAIAGEPLNAGTLLATAVIVVAVAVAVTTRPTQAA